jgi:hypothetical protein
MRNKKFPSLQFMNRDRMRLLLNPLRNDRSMPLTTPLLLGMRVLPFSVERTS